MDFSRWLSFTPLTVLKQTKETRRELWTGGLEERQTVRQPDTNEKEDREGEGGGLSPAVTL